MNTLEPLNLLAWQDTQRLHRNQCYLKIGLLILLLLAILMGSSEGLLLWRQRHWLAISQKIHQQLSLKQPTLRLVKQLHQQQQQFLQQQQRLNIIATQNQQLTCQLQNIINTISPEIMLSQLNISASEAQLIGTVSTEAIFNTWLQQLAVAINITQQQLKVTASTTQAGNMAFQLHLIWQ